MSSSGNRRRRRFNTTGQDNRRPYVLGGRARTLGFISVRVIDENLGISGSGGQQRLGFSRLLAALRYGDVLGD